MRLVQKGMRSLIQSLMLVATLVVIDWVSAPLAETVQYLVGLKFSSSSLPFAVISCVAVIVPALKADWIASMLSYDNPICFASSACTCCSVKFGFFTRIHP